MLFSTRTVLSVLAALSCVVQVTAAPVPEKGEGGTGVHRSNSVKKSTSRAKHSLCGRTTDGPACSPHTSSGSSRKSNKQPPPKCPATFDHQPHSRTPSPASSRSGSPHHGGPHKRAIHTLLARTPSKLFHVQEHGAGGKKHEGRYDDCEIGAGTAVVYPVTEWAGKATHEWVMKTWLDHSDWPSDDELKAEVTALTITQRLGAFGSIEVRDQSIVGPVIVMTRADGIPTDRHPKKAEHDQKHLESLVHSAVEALHADAVLGWLLNDLHFGNFALNEAGTAISDTFDKGLGIFENPAAHGGTAAWNHAPANQKGSFSKFTKDKKEIEKVLREKWNLPAAA